MTNAAITSNAISPDQVIAEIEVVLPNANANLASLTVSHGELKPAFNSTTLYYTVCIGGNIGEVKISATPSDSNATVSGGMGWQTITKDSTMFTITVTAEDGVTTKDYVVTVIKCDVGIESITNDELRITGYEVYDIMGRKHVSRHCGLDPQSSVMNEILKQVQNDVSHLANGIYILKIQTNKGIIIKKIIINE